MSTRGRSSAQILSKALLDKKKKTAGFSMRLMAQKMGLSHSYLSRVFQGKKNLATDHIPTVCQMLDLDDTSRILLEKSLILESSKRRGIKSADTLLNKKASFQNLETFEEVSDKNLSLHDDWYLIPLLDLTTLEGFQNKPAAIARKLGITSAQVQKGYERLLESGYLKEKDGKLIKASQKMRFPTVKSLPKIRAYHKKMIQKAVHELDKKTDEKSFQKRLISGMCIAANPEKITQAKQILQAALHEVASVLSEGNCTELYHLNAQLFSLLEED